MTFRDDVQGLRAIAVLAVMIFHFDPDWLPGGFIGVDIFFVISGFLITGNIFKERAAARFSLAEFYRRRIKRIIPVLTVVILVTLVAGHFILLPDDFSRLAWTALASQLSLANVYFTYFLDTGYFAADAKLEPLLHLWSLGVEEQFYLLWPTALLLCLALPFRISLLIFAGVATASFALGEFLLPLDPQFAFYMLPTRAGELLAGALCFFAVQLRPPESRAASEAIWMLGATLVAISLIFADEARFPGVRALPVAVGVATMIYGGSRSRLACSISVRPMVWIGALSYSLYLWHWPVLAYARYMKGTLSIEILALCAAIILLLSLVSFYRIPAPKAALRG